MKIKLAENGDILIHNSEEILNEILLVFDNNGSLTALYNRF